jgi:hypothetical protein
MPSSMPESRIYRRLIAYLLLIGIASVTAACGLVSYGFPKRVVVDAADYWCELKAPYPPPLNKTEDAAVLAATSRDVVKIKNITAICLAANENDQLVVTVSGMSQSPDLLSNKEITYYHVSNGKICGFSKTIREPSPDVDYELTIFNAAVKSKVTGNKSVIIYSRPEQNLTVVGNADVCVAEVSVVFGFEPYKEPFSSRLVPVCSQIPAPD